MTVDYELTAPSGSSAHDFSLPTFITAAVAPYHVTHGLGLEAHYHASLMSSSGERYGERLALIAGYAKLAAQADSDEEQAIAAARRARRDRNRALRSV